jgi:hypothetical protein
VRFSESVPSAKTAIGRIEDVAKLEQLQEDHQLRRVRSETAANEAEIALYRSRQKLEELQKTKRDDSLEAQVRRSVEAEVRKRMETAMGRIEFAAALKDVRQQLLASAAWKKLSVEEQEKLSAEIADDLDAAEARFK